MKKQFFVLAAATIAVCSLAACDNKNSSNEKNQYDSLNTMLDASYSQIVISVTDVFDENITLSSVYTIKYGGSNVKIEYSVEKLAEISLDAPTSDVKITFTGEATITGTVIEGGSEVGLTAADARVGLTFKEEYFENTKLGGSFLKADVKDPSGFLGLELTCSDMKVDATFLDAFLNIKITYVSESGGSVEYKYVFSM